MKIKVSRKQARRNYNILLTITIVLCVVGFTMVIGAGHSMEIYGTPESEKLLLISGIIFFVGFLLSLVCDWARKPFKK